MPLKLGRKFYYILGSCMHAVSANPLPYQPCMHAPPASPLPYQSAFCRVSHACTPPASPLPCQSAFCHASHACTLPASPLPCQPAFCRPMHRSRAPYRYGLFKTVYNCGKTGFNYTQVFLGRFICYSSGYDLVFGSARGVHCTWLVPCTRASSDGVDDSDPKEVWPIGVYGHHIMLCCGTADLWRARRGLKLRLTQDRQRHDKPLKSWPWSFGSSFPRRTCFMFCVS
ncbi:hypothetical protein M9H77_18738 [Catharanthus roseus]|uniref:Uncharacterized protein n=1 Tax=Catharanthus roseus TaxID=4058 RepID=A0ACC0B8A3_CATRO|nr:hypothetical protein M9H77_18738 [Catharanthus roseus]